MKKLTFVQNLQNPMHKIIYVVLNYSSTKNGIYAETSRFHWEYIGKDMILYSVE